MTTAEYLNNFNENLNYDGPLPENFKVLNPFQDGSDAKEASQEFNQKYYNNTNKRRMILDINPSRLGGGHTGITLTDTHHLKDVCGIDFKGSDTYEISSVFFYEMIAAYGGAEKFYNEFYVNSVFPLAIETMSPKDHWVNAGYYENKFIHKDTQPFIDKTMAEQVTFNIDTSTAFVMATQNYDYMVKMNEEKHYFDKIVPLVHPRYVAEYYRQDTQKYIDQYFDAFKQ